MQKAIPIPQGALFTITTGCYSDYQVSGVFKALKEIDTDKLKEAWIAVHPEQSARHEFEDAAFLADCVRQGLFEQVECWEWHTETYSSIDFSVSKIGE